MQKHTHTSHTTLFQKMSKEIDIGIYIYIFMHITLNHKMFVDIFHSFHMFFSVCVFETKKKRCQKMENTTIHGKKHPFSFQGQKNKNETTLPETTLPRSEGEQCGGGLFWTQETHNTPFAKKYLSAASKSVGVPKNKNCESFLCVFYLNFLWFFIVCVNVFICGVLSVTFVAFLKSRIKMHYPHHSPHSRIQSIQSWPTMGS